MSEAVENQVHCVLIECCYCLYQATLYFMEKSLEKEIEKRTEVMEHNFHTFVTAKEKEHLFLGTT